MPTKDEILNTLRGIGECAENYTNGTLNSGGCCVFAAMVAEQLADRCKDLGIIVRGVVMDSWMMFEKSVDACRPPAPDNRNMEAWSENGMFFSHVILSLTFPDNTEYYYDCARLVPVPFNRRFADHGVLDGFLTPEEMQGIADGNDWNETFDRGLIPDIREMIEEAFEELACEPA